MKIHAEVITVGNLAAEDTPALVGVPGAQLRLTDGRVVTITGLTREEARDVAEHSGKPVVLRIDSQQEGTQ